MSEGRFFMHVDKENGQPIVQPLKSLDEIYKWKAGCDEGCVARTPLRVSHSVINRVPHELPIVPRTLVCHDMAGGYLEDRYIQGVRTNDCYRFFNWSGLDLFVYFSHEFVTIPPPCWTNAAHQNGVRMLGTVITEWKDGKEICEQFLKTEEAMRAFVDKLVAISVYYKFDGWLINIENEIAVDVIPMLLEFLKELTRAMHKELPASKVIWYDSVIKSGALEWQNELNALNKEFFDACDGIFLNYTWKDGNLERSREVAEERIFDVYVGVDVFGRGCRGGGGFNTIEALATARCHGLSAAIFAPGWVYEKLNKNEFIENENKFWEYLKPDCTLHSFATLPVTTTFCQGWGGKFHLGGKIISHSPWANMSLQTIQLCGPQSNVAYNSDVAYCGGGSLRIMGKEQHEHITSVKLLALSTELRKEQGLYVSFSYQSELVVENTMVGLRLELDTDEYVLGMTQDTALLGSNADNNVIIVPALPVDSEDSPTPLREIMSADSEESEWITNWYHIQPGKACTVTSVSLLLVPGKGFGEPCVNLGGIRIIPDDHHLVIPEITNCRATDLSCKNKVAESGTFLEKSLILYWECNTNVDFVLVYHKDSSDWTLIGSTNTNIFKVCKLECKAVMSQFKLQPVYYGGLYVDLDKCPITTVISQIE